MLGVLRRWPGPLRRLKRRWAEEFSPFVLLEGECACGRATRGHGQRCLDCEVDAVRPRHRHRAARWLDDQRYARLYALTGR